jgi:protein TonB
MAKPVGRGAATAFEPAQVDTPPQLIKAYPPHYPYMAKRDDITGSITLQFVVTKDGNAVDTTVVQSEPKGVFDQAALRAIEQYRFKPGTKDGKAVEVRVNLPIRFNLS